MNNQSRHSGKTALLLVLDCLQWHEARPISYNVSYGIEDALRNIGLECTTIPVHGEVPSTSPVSWLQYVRSLEVLDTYDFLFVWIPHSKFDQDTWEWLSTLAPVRVGILMESMHYEEIYQEANTLYKERANLVFRQLPYLTHVLCSDEHDVKEISDATHCTAYWWPATVAKDFIRDEVSQATEPMAAFFGTPYYKRRDWLTHPKLESVLVRPPSPEDSTELPQAFDAINQRAMRFLSGETQAGLEPVEQYVVTMRLLRQKLYEAWLLEQEKWLALVNLPALVRTYPGRVVEAMSVGRPAISNAIPSCPLLSSLFSKDELLLYDQSKPEELFDLIQMLQQSPGKVNEIAEKGRSKVSEFHTTERRLKDTLTWIQEKVEAPDYPYLK